MKTIPLSQGKVAIVDDEDYEWAKDFKWSYGGKHYPYAVRRVGGRKNSKWTVLHRLIVNAPLGVDVDHKNGDTLDNRRSNLRLATTSQNLCNRGPMSNNTSGYKGVNWHKGHRMWRMNIQLQGKQRTSYHHDIKDAARAYNEAAKELHGEFARLNEVEDE